MVQLKELNMYHILIGEVILEMIEHFILLVEVI